MAAIDELRGTAKDRPAGASRGPVEIVGAGPAGLAAAITLARAGRRVVVRARRFLGWLYGPGRLRRVLLPWARRRVAMSRADVPL